MTGNMKIIYRLHAVERLYERGIQPEEVRAALESGEAIEKYPDDGAYPARLVLGGKGKRAVHVVAADNLQDDELIVVTGYRPGRGRWSDDLKRRRDEVLDV
ncbi:MAG TPA: DUF4258 domain-containing protein [Anaerolineales bacterium]|jgi:hypothetical protein